MYKIKKWVSALLAGMMLFALFPGLSFAAEAQQTQEPSVVREEVALREEFSKHFLLSDGSFMAISYPEAVHVRSGDGWEEIDNTVSLNQSSAALKTRNQSFPVEFSASAAGDRLVSMQSGGRQLSWSLKAVAGEQLYAASETAAAVPERLAKAADFASAPKAFGTVEYSQVFGGLQNVSVRYTVMQHKLEEDIILHERGAITAFRMEMSAPGLRAAADEYNRVLLSDGEQTVYRISAPYMCDAADTVLNDFTVDIAQQGDQICITYTPQSGWLEDSARVYPVLFDPAITTSEYKSGIIDTYVVQGDTAAHGSEQRIYAGIKNGKVHRSYIKITSLPAIPDNMPITKAELCVRNTNGSTTGRVFGLYKVYSNWNEDTITYANQPQVSGCIATDAFEASDLVNTFSLSSDLNSFYPEYFSGMNYGYMLRYTDESTANPDYNSFYSSEFTTRASRPYIKIYYSYALPSCLANGAAYSMKNAASGKYLSVFGGTDANGTNICQLAKDDTAKQQFKLDRTADGAYLLRAKCSSNGANRVLDIAKSGGYVQSGCNVQLYTNVDEIAQEWVITSVGQGFRISPRTNMALALTAVGTADGTSGGKTATSAGNVCVSSYTGASSQIWYFYNASGAMVSQNTSPYLANGEYYFNNAATGKYMRRSASSIAGASGTLASLGDSVKWDVVGIGNGQHVIRARGSKTSYLAGSSQLLNATVSMQTVSDSTVPNNCRWAVSYDNGTVFTNAATGYVLCEVNGELRAYPSSSAQNKRWRCATTVQYGDGSALSNILRELDSNFSISDMRLETGETKTPVINKTPTSATVAWATASDFTYAASPKEPVSINEFTGEITGLKGGATIVTATHKVTGRTKSFLVRVSASSKDVLHPDNVEYIRYTRVSPSYNSHLIGVVKSKIYEDEIFTAFNERSNFSREFLVTQGLKDKLHKLDSGYRGHFIITWATGEEKAAYKSKNQVDELVRKGYFKSGSTEYYGVWAWNYEVELKKQEYWRGVINSGLTEYGLYILFSNQYYSSLADYGTTTVSSEEYKTVVNRVNSIAEEFTHNPSSNKVMLGTSTEQLTWYQAGEQQGMTYFYSPKWDTYKEQYGKNILEMANQQFLFEQKTAGKQFWFSHNPIETLNYHATSSFAMELEWLRNSYGIEKLTKDYFIESGAYWYFSPTGGA